MADGNSQPQPSSVLNEFRTRLSGQKVNAEAKRPTLSFSVRKDGLPQINVRTGVPNDKDYGRITAKLPLFEFYAILAMIEGAVKAPNGYKDQVRISAVKFIQGKRSDPMPESFIHIGKDDNGVVWIGVTSWEKERPVIKFPFVPDDLIRFHHGDGTPYSAAEASMLMARSYVDALRSLMAIKADQVFVPPPPRENIGGGGYGGGNRGGGNWNNNRGGGGGGYSGGNSGDYGASDDFPI